MAHTAPTRDNIIAGPAKFTFDSKSLFSEGDAQYEVMTEQSDIRVSGAKIDEAVTDSMVRLTFRPDGRINSDIIALLWPYLNSNPGVGLFSTVDKALTIADVNSHLHTIKAAALTRMPDLIFSTEEPMIGEVEFTGLRLESSLATVADSMVTAATSGGTFADTAFDPAQIKRQYYYGALTGITGLTDVESLTGFRVSFPMEIARARLQSIGTYQYFLRSISCEVRFTPADTTAANLITALKVQDTGASVGTKRSANAVQFTITGADGVAYFTCPKMAVRSIGQRFGSGDNTLRPGEVSLIANRTFSTGAQVALATLAAS